MKHFAEGNSKGTEKLNVVSVFVIRERQQISNLLFTDRGMKHMPGIKYYWCAGMMNHL